MKLLLLLIFPILFCKQIVAQPGFAFTHITTEDGLGLASNLVTSIYQDEKGFLWVGTANGLQRFDGSKFVNFSITQSEKENLQHGRISQIIPYGKGKLAISMFNLREFGIFDPSTFVYRKITIKPKGIISPGAEFRMWRDSKGELYLTAQDYGVLRYDAAQNAFVENTRFIFPAKWKVSLLGSYEAVDKQQFWFACDSGLCIYDVRSRQMWSRQNNPQNLAILNNSLIRKNLSQVFIDHRKKIWIIQAATTTNGAQNKFCFDSNGKTISATDTTGITHGFPGTEELKFFFETRHNELWVYGYNALLNYDKRAKRFYYIKTEANNSIQIDYESVFQVMEDSEGNIWIATNKGIFYTATGSANEAIVNLKFNNQNGPTSINDIEELDNGDLWFTSWRNGVTAIDKNMHKTANYLYKQPPPPDWPAELKAAALQTLSLGKQTETGNIYVGCNNGVLLVHDPIKRTTRYLHPSMLDHDIINYIVEDHQKIMWLATKNGKIVKYTNNTFTEVANLGTNIYKILFDADGWIWAATKGKGLYALNAANGKVLQHYTAEAGQLYTNSGTDLEELKNGLIAFGAGALHFINKKNGKVKQIKYEDGLPSNTISKLRLDNRGFLWIITSNGLCSYNPNNNHITPYTRKDGVVLAEETIAADYLTSDGNIIFGGSNSVVFFNPATFSYIQAPVNVTITDFKLFNKYLPIDSLQSKGSVKLNYDQNSITLYFASLNYRQRDKLTYYYKMDGVDKDWIKADRSYFVNYSLLPPGKYMFNIYSENIEGMKSPAITTCSIIIKPPYWRTWWFISSLLFALALLIYAIHDLRLKRLLAVEHLRNRVARDLHDDMGSTLSTINILTTMAINKIYTDTAKTADYLQKIGEYSQKMMDVMDDIVWSIKPSNDSMQKITARMREFATHVLEAKEIDFIFTIEDQVNDVKLNMEARRDFFLVFKEAVNNAAKYSKATVLNIDIKMQGKRMVLVVQDNGSGFDIANADGNGLGNMQKRADNLNGEVTIKSIIGQGTTVRLMLPVLF